MAKQHLITTKKASPSSSAEVSQNSLTSLGRNIQETPCHKEQAEICWLGGAWDTLFVLSVPGCCWDFPSHCSAGLLAPPHSVVVLWGFCCHSSHIATPQVLSQGDGGSCQFAALPGHFGGAVGDWPGLGDGGDRDLLWWRMCEITSRDVRPAWHAGSGTPACKLVPRKDCTAGTCGILPRQALRGGR